MIQTSRQFVKIFAAVALPVAVLFVLIRILGSWVLSASCDPSGYHPGVFMASCQNPYYVDYEHGAFFYQLEPQAIRNLRAADVLIMGSSRPQFAFSADATANYFAVNRWRYFLFGFAYVQKSAFPEILMRRLNLHPKLLIIDADPFFSDQLNGPAENVVNEDARFSYRLKQIFQSFHARLCVAAHALCVPKDRTLYRSSSDGRWIWLHSFSEDVSLPIAKPVSISQREMDKAVDTGRRFLADVRLPKACVILTGVPTRTNAEQSAAILSRALGLPDVQPAISGLATLDGEHLNRESATRWSQAFFKVAETAIRRCLDLYPTTKR